MRFRLLSFVTTAFIRAAACGGQSGPAAATTAHKAPAPAVDTPALLKRRRACMMGAHEGSVA